MGTSEPVPANMHIKQLTIHGFKSYRDQVVVGPFSAGHNVVVGRNGSGKSNFFAAIRFVLHDAYTKLGQEERQALLHEGGSGGGVNQIAAYVEIVFDNADGRFPTGRDEVVIRRTVGLKKDEYSLDKKPVTYYFLIYTPRLIYVFRKTDILNLLQSAGFSKSNPYYIVPQGRITALTNARDSDRLQLLKEVAGTRVYEEHREESLKIMKETEAKKEKIVELLGFIEERLKELEQEKNDLSEYYTADRERRACEYLIYSTELEKTNDLLVSLENEYREVIESEGKQIEADDEQLTRIKAMEEQLASLSKILMETEEEKKQLTGDLEDLVKGKTQLELLIDDLEDDSRRYRSEEARIESVLSKVEAEIEVKEQVLGQLAPQVIKLEEQEITLKHQLEESVVVREALQAKRNRASQFRSESERNKWINKEIEGLSKSKDLDTAQLENLSEELETFTLKEADMKEQLGTAVDPAVRLQDLDMEWQEARRERDAAMETRKELWRAQAKLENSLANIDDELGKLQREAVAATNDRNAISATDLVTRLAQKLAITCHGPLHGLFAVSDPAFSQAVDLVAGASLHHVVVDTDEDASRLLEALRREGSGRVTFMPLNRLKESLPLLDMVDGTPLINKLEFDPRFSAAMAHVFGKSVVCKDLATCAAVTRTHRVDTLTLTGDRVSRKGALTGGSTEDSRGKNKVRRLDALTKLRQWSNKRLEHIDTLAKVKARLTDVDQAVTVAVGKMQTVDCERSEIRLGKSPVETLKKELASLAQIIASKRASIIRLGESIKVADQKIKSLEVELATPFTPDLSPAETQQLVDATTRFDQLSKELNRCSSELTRCVQEQKSVEQELEANLRRRRSQLHAQLAQVSTAHTSRSLQLHNEELKQLASRLERLRTDLDRVQSMSDQYHREQSALASALDKARTLLDNAHNNSAVSHELARYQSKRKALLQKRQEANEKVREIGVVPEETIAALKSRSNSHLLSCLHNAREHLRTYGHINKKAAEQYSSFSKQGEQLSQRLVDLEASAKAIGDFIHVLDARKDEAINSTFDQVSVAFSNVFMKLVPTGHASLQMVRQPDESGNVQFTGVSMRAAFNSISEDEGLLMQQLSGGQKTLVSLALILAIQQTDPAPFYLFDEVDAALDAAHRTALADLLDSMSHQEGGPTVQFITTTFRPELLQRADKFFGVSFGNRISRVEDISKDAALEFIETAQH